MFSDIKQLMKNPFLIISLLAISAIPALYTAIFLGSMWDPYNQLDEIQISVVNEDAGSELNGEPLNVGERIENELAENEEFYWQFTDAETARNNLENGSSYAIIHIPDNVSEQATTLLDEEPELITIDVTTNPGFNFVGSMMGTESGAGVADAISTTVGETYTSTLMDALTEVATSTGDIETALSDMKEGANQLRESNEELQAGLNQAAPALGPAGAQLTQGNTEITAGLLSLEENLGALEQEVADGSAQIDEYSFTGHNAESIISPVEINESEITDMNNYGQSFAPFIIAVSLFVGAVAFSVIFPINRSTENYSSAIAMSVSKLIIISVQAVISTLVVASVIQFMFDFPIDEPVKFYGIMILWAFASLLFVTLLVSLFGNIGKFITIILLIIQLSASAGTFPIETAGGLYQAVHPILPMSYVIAAMREAIFSFEGSMSYSDAVIYTIAMTVGSIIILQLINFLKFKFSSFEGLIRKLSRIQY